jgi:hypothetical protein
MPLISLEAIGISASRVETKMHFSVFAKMRKSCENGQIFAKFRFAKIFRFRENISEFSRNRKTPIFANIFAKILWNFRENEKLWFSRKCPEISAKKGENVRKVLVTFLQKRKHRFSRKLLRKIFEIQKMQCCGAGTGAASFGQSRSRNAMRLRLQQWY